ncbi:MAG: hypothetical protein Q7J64_03850 [Elusimicrobiota bacterium]|nr:hypothetical protein [Elusimicrobiota bacterium]
MYKEGLALRAWAYALALLVFCLPVASPDAWWHLSAGRWIWANAAIPMSETFSFTRAGAAWIDFEWGFQLLLYPFGLLGDWGLWAAKALLLALAYLPVDGLLRDRKTSPHARALGAALWAAAVLPSADLRADLISAGLFAWQLRRLVAGRASFLPGFVVFACWANLHAGFALGLALYPAWALVLRLARKQRPDGLWAEACGAALGTFLNPWGLSLYGVILTHALDPVRAAVAEWGSLSLRYPFQWAFAAELAAGVWVLWRARRSEPGLAAAAAALTAAAVFSARFNPYWAAAAVPLLAAALPAGAALFVISVLLAAALRAVPWGAPYHDVYVARRAADFVVAERAAFDPLRLFNTYEWGGYLGWRLGPERRVYGDGRYLFHGQLVELQEALSGAAPMAAFIERNGLNALLIKNYPTKIAGVRVYPDGSRRELWRPWYATYLPRERWALVWWDDKALVFVDRAKVPAAWLAAHEYRWLRPGDGEALADALARGEAPAAVVAAEKARHAAQ